MADHLFEIAQLALGAPYLKALSVSGDRDARRVVAAILQLPQALDNDIDDRLLTYVSHDAAHLRIVSLANFSARGAPIS